MINVLIVEDEQAIRRFLRTALEAEGLRVHEAETLQRGLIEAATRKPDLVILDLGLPDGDGLDFIRDLRQWSQMPVIVLSARAEESDKIAALDAGATITSANRLALASCRPACALPCAVMRPQPLANRWWPLLIFASIWLTAASSAVRKRSI